MFGNLALGVAAVAKLMGVEPTDLSVVDDPRGRVDHLASKLIENGAKQLAPELQATYLAAKPLIDGLLKQHLGRVRIAIPKDVEDNAAKVLEQYQGRAA